MIRLMNSRSILQFTSELLPSTYTNYQTVRWRKPRWVPIAKSKVFRVAPRCVIPKDESQELLRLHNNYRTQIKSIRRFLIEKYDKMSKSVTDPEQLNQQFLEDFNNCTKLNDQWNDKQRIQRELGVAEEHEAELNFARRRIQLKLIEAQEKLELAEERVIKEIEESVNYITPEKLDDCIEYAINNPIDYNFAIDLQGNRIVGRETKPAKEHLAAKEATG